MTRRVSQSEADITPPPYKVIAEQIAALLMVSKEVGADQDTTKVALQTFGRACDAGRSDGQPQPF